MLDYRCKSLLPALIQISANGAGKAVDNGLLPLCETKMEFQALGFGLAQLLVLKPFG